MSHGTNGSVHCPSLSCLLDPLLTLVNPFPPCLQPLRWSCHLPCSHNSDLENAPPLVKKGKALFEEERSYYVYWDPNISILGLCVQFHQQLGPGDFSVLCHTGSHKVWGSTFADSGLKTQSRLQTSPLLTTGLASTHTVYIGRRWSTNSATLAHRGRLI